MANIFAILTAVVLAISAFLAYQNMGRAEEHGRGYKGWLTKTKDQQDQLARKRSQLKATQKELDDTSAELAQFEADNVQLQGELDTQLATNQDLDAKVASAQRESEQKATEVASKKKAIEDIGDVDQVLAELKQTQREIAQLDLDIAQGEAQQAATEAQRVTVDRSLVDVKERIRWRSSGKSNPKLSTRVRRVYPNLGFLTLSGGDNLGIVKDSTLEVLRDGAVIAKLLVTTVEASTSAADIIPDSLAPGESVRAGDSVRGVAEAAPPATEPVPVAAPAPAPIDPEPAGAAPLEEPMEDDNPFG